MSGPYFCDDYGQVYKMNSEGCWRFDGVLLGFPERDKEGRPCFEEQWTPIDTVTHHAREMDRGLVANMIHRFELDAVGRKKAKGSRD